MTVLIVMGVAGSGKSTVGPLLAARLALPFHDADRFHPASNIAKMQAGIPLEDEDRKPWLSATNAFLRAEQAAGRGCVIACSALRQRYRDWLTEGLADARFVYLRGDPGLIAGRLADRRGHFMPARLLESQFATLEEPADAVSVDVSGTPDEIASAALAALGR